MASVPPIVQSFTLCKSAVKTNNGYNLIDVSCTFLCTKPICLDLSAFIAISSIRGETNLFITFSDARTEYEGIRSAPLTISAEHPRGLLHLLAHIPEAEFPEYGKYIARLVTESGDILSQIPFWLEDQNASPEN
ncbi:hypothetical protein HG66A1_42620 [Gimesia chilikensis]|uniref:Uncharacterized protein n=1 Tax=Gimesia chilikensis TaxID=2605989 RepID=A0A517PSW1_9PLAN|nr:hypothetical protein HG66A1_42620 [Gimesia chilikensis]